MFEHAHVHQGPVRGPSAAQAARAAKVLDTARRLAADEGLDWTQLDHAERIRFIEQAQEI